MNLGEQEGRLQGSAKLLFTGFEAEVVCKKRKNILKTFDQHFGRPLSELSLQGRAKKFLLSLVTHVPSGLMGFALAA